MDKINDLLDSDTAEEACCIDNGMDEGCTVREKKMSVLISKIYSLAHPAGNCPRCHDRETDV
jgi:hypothetical protein